MFPRVDGHDLEFYCVNFFSGLLNRVYVGGGRGRPGWEWGGGCGFVALYHTKCTFNDIAKLEAFRTDIK